MLRQGKRGKSGQRETNKNIEARIRRASEDYRKMLCLSKHIILHGCHRDGSTKMLEILSQLRTAHAIRFVCLLHTAVMPLLRAVAANIC